MPRKDNCPVLGQHVNCALVPKHAHGVERCRARRFLGVSRVNVAVSRCRGVVLRATKTAHTRTFIHSGKSSPLEITHADWVIRSRTLTILQPHTWHAKTSYFRSPVSTSTFLSRVGNSSAVAEQVISSKLKGKEEVLAHVTVAIVFLSPDLGQPVAVPQREKLLRLLSAAAGPRGTEEVRSVFSLGEKLRSRFPSIFALKTFPGAPSGLTTEQSASDGATSVFKTVLIPRTSDIDTCKLWIDTTRNHFLIDKRD